MSLTSSTTYTAKVVITESGGAQSLDFYVDINGDDDYLDANEHPLGSLGEVDDDWSAGQVGRGPARSSCGPATPGDGGSGPRLEHSD